MVGDAVACWFQFVTINVLFAMRQNQCALVVQLVVLCQNQPNLI